MDRQKYWDNKILGWERAKYDRSARFVDVNRSVKARMQLALSLMKPFIRGRVVVEYGCGTARMMDDVLALGARKYIGVDFSATAIEVAKSRAKNLNQVELLCSSIESLEKIPADLNFSLGLTDWVEPSYVARLNAPLFLHSFSELRPASWQQAAHRMYSKWINASKHQPAYYHKDEMEKHFGASVIYRNSSLSFGSFIYNF